MDSESFVNRECFARMVDIRSIHTIRTADNATVEIELAGVGNRIFAFLIDAVMMFILLMFSWLIALNARQINQDIALALFYLLPFLVFFGYHFLQEWLWNGKSLGKHLLNIRVVRNNGQPIGVWESLGRNLFRLVDVWFSGIGLLPMLLSHREKRFGDFLAGTIVINDQRIEKPLEHPSGELPVDVAPPPHLDEEWLRLGGRLTPEEFDLLRTYLSRQEILLAEARQDIAEDFRVYLGNRLQLPDDTLARDDLLANLYFGYREALKR